MLGYLLARNCNITKNIEEIISITVIKYIVILLAIKVIEYKYLELGFFNYYVLAIISFDIVFMIYHYIKTRRKEKNNIHYYTDDIITNDFSMSAYANEINEIRKEKLKRKETSGHIYQHKVNKDAETYNTQQESDKVINIHTVIPESTDVIENTDVPLTTEEKEKTTIEDSDIIEDVSQNIINESIHINSENIDVILDNF